ncbi:hypothetical protein [Streptosporangium sp. NBC_01469]|uniref:hypothetical protein n=1 Tax=Streptosporangium sp. NBC_01469 TaxID=2903898 RepID=UPI002E294B3C|nr:hypothetical protein [Streptosporangium sp. NBC_01469]
MIDDYLTSEKACARLGITWRTPDNPPKRSEGSLAAHQGRPRPLRPADQLDAWRAVHPTRRKKHNKG